MSEIFALYKLVLLNHIRTKTTCPLFHEKSEDFYNLLFDVFHEIMEKRQDLWLDETADENTAYKSTYEAIEKVKTSLESMVKESNSVGMDNLLRGLIDKLEFACGTARGFIKEEEEEKEESPDTKDSKRQLLSRM